MKIEITSRYGDKRAISRVGPGEWLFDPNPCAYVRCAMDEDGNISMVDPDGGPYIHVGMQLNEVFDSLGSHKISRILTSEKTGIYIILTDE